MKVLLLNGSPRAAGCTYTALRQAADVLEACGMETEIFHLCQKPVPGCRSCLSCRKTGRCVFDDCVNVVREKLENADGLIVGAPVYYASPNGEALAALDRIFYAGGHFAHKPAAAIVSARRAGTTAALEVLQKYFTISQMPVVSSQYWPMVHGNSPEEVLQDEEGLQIVRTLARNMAWLLQCIEAGRKAGVTPPEREPRKVTNFIR